MRLLLIGLAALLALPVVLGVELNCTWKASCTGGEVGILRAENDSGGFENAHVQLMNDTGTDYAYTLCCVTDAQHTMTSDCTNGNATTFLKLNDTTNAHAQVPSINTYAENACIAINPGQASCQWLNASCTGEYQPLLSMASSETNGGLYNQTNAHVGNYSDYRLNVCCRGGNGPPSTPILQSPNDGNDTLFNRTVDFDWQDSSDPDGDDINYTINITQATCADESAIVSVSSYTSSELCVDQLYEWRVKACDQQACSAWSDTWNFTVASTIGLTFTVNNTDFGQMTRNTTDNTTDATPPPFRVENTGNVVVNVTIRGENPLFETSGLGNNSFQYKAREDEAGAYGGGQESWTNVSATYTELYTNFGYTDSGDSAYADVLVDLPNLEPAGTKSSVVTVLGTVG